MAASGFTPIQLYYSGTLTNVPLAGNLAYGELAINIADGKMYFKNSSNVVTKIADAATATGSVVGGTTGAVVYQSAPSTSTFLSLGTLGHLITAGASAPVYTNPSSVTVGNATNAVTATNVAGGSTNQIVFQSGAGATTFLATPTSAGSAVIWNGSNIAWGLGPSAATAANLSGGSAGRVPYQSALDTTAFTAVGTAGYVLTSQGTSAPTWTLPTASASAGGAIWENTTTISSNYTLSASKNGFSVGPITIASGAAVTVPSGQRWVVY
jgi:hypothetical protein